MVTSRAAGGRVARDLPGTATLYARRQEKQKPGIYAMH